MFNLLYNDKKNKLHSTLALTEHFVTTATAAGNYLLRPNDSVHIGI